MTDDIKAIRDALAAGPVAGPWNTAEYTDHDGPPECDDIAIQATDPRRPLHLETLALMNWANKVPMVAAFTRAEGTATAAYIASVHPERIARLLDALEQASKDAARWRWLREHLSGDGPMISEAMRAIGQEYGWELDPAIDAAMKRGA